MGETVASMKILFKGKHLRLKGRFCPAVILGLSAWTLLLISLPVFGKMVFQIMPRLSISEEYSDNYLKSASKQEEFVTSYAPGLNLSLVDVNKRVFLNYTPTYRDYKNLDERDGITHIITMDAQFTPAKHTELAATVAYEGRSDDYQGENRERTASFSGKTQAGKNTDIEYSHRYSKRFEQQLRTGAYKEHTLNTSRAGLSHQYGKKDFIRATFIYESDSYSNSDDDAYKKIAPDASVTHWFSQFYGMETGLSYLKKDFDQDTSDLDTYSGYIRGIRAFSEHLDGYVKYRHSYTDTPTYTHHIFHPSFGMDWDVSEDSGISLGLGLLVHDRSDKGTSTAPFVDINAFKSFEFNPRTSLTLTGTSSYSDSGDDGDSLGFQTSYRAGAVFSHRLSKQIGSNLFGSYTRTEFDDPKRSDNEAMMGAGLTWSPLKWLQFGVNYSFSDYRGSGALREDYQDNRITFRVSLVPETPIRPDKQISRQTFEGQIYSPDYNWSAD